MCIDYSIFASDHTLTGYFQLAADFGNLAPVSLEFLQSLYDLGFNPDLGMIFGMSYGAQVMIWAGKNLKPKISLGHCK